MSLRTKVLVAVAGAALTLPATAGAEPTVDAARAIYQDLGLTQLTSMPSGRVVEPTATAATNFGYRTYEEINAELQALADANPGFVRIKTAARQSVQGREVKYLEISNNVDSVETQAKPVFFNMSLIHGNEWAASEQAIEFVYDVINQSKTNPKVKALFDKVKFIAMPVVSPDGLALYRRQNANGVDMNRNYPFGWGSNIGVSFAQRGSGPGSEPEVQNTMDIVRENQVVALVTTHSASHAFFYPGLEIAAGLPADLGSIRDLSLAMADATNIVYTNVRDSAHDYETSGETNDWSYYATRGFAVTLEVVGGSRDCSGANATNKGTQAPNWRNCMAADYTGTPGPTATANQIATYGGKPVRNSLYQALVYATLADGHSVLRGTAPAGAKLEITKDFDLFTNTIKLNTTPASTAPPQAIPTHLESSITVPASGRFSWNINPSVRPNPPYRAEGMVPGPNGFLQESWTLTCTLPDGTVAETRGLTIDKGEIADLSLCTQGGVGGTVPSTLSLTLGAPASFGAFTPGVARDYTASTTASTVSTAGDATLSVADPSPTATGRLVNGTFALASPLQAAAGSAAFAAVGGSAAPTPLLTYSGPVSNDVATVNFTQSIGANEALRTGTYAKTLTFTLSTTTP
jgi:hypothetical protein